MKFLNRLLYLVHRWLGLVLALFMFVWFASGLVIMYATPTTQSRGQQLAHAETLSPEVGWLSLGDAWALSLAQRQKEPEKKTKAEGADSKAKESPATVTGARLLRIAGEPRWLVDDSKGRHFAVSALDGSLRQTNVKEALQIARNWFEAEGNAPGTEPRFVETLENPVILRNQETFKPFHHIALDDGQELLISQGTGEVLHASSRADRVMYLLGNWVHLFKPLESLGLGGSRHDVQVWSGFLATVATLAGLIIGWLRWRPGLRGKPTYSEGRTQPYRESWLKWHFWSGLIGGTLALFWALSGYVSTNPWKLFTPNAANPQETARYWQDNQEAGLPSILHRWQPALPLALAAAAYGSDVVELGWRHLGDESVLLAYTRDGQRLAQTEDGAAPKFSEATLLAAVQRVNAKAKVQSQTLLNEYNTDYYPRHHQDALEKPLPVLQVALADQAGTSFYLDPLDGKLLAKPDNSSRAMRWLYAGLHHWDFGWLYYRPVWDVWMLVWVAFGLVLSASSLVLGWRLLKKTVAPKKRPVRSKRAASRPVAEAYPQTGLAYRADDA